jgi:hypothetical protein
VWKELPVLHLAAGFVTALLLRYVHDGIFVGGGAAIVGAAAAGAALEGLQSWRRARRRAPQPRSA